MSSISSTTASRLWRNHGLSIVLVLLFAATFVGQVWAGWLDYNVDQREHASPPVELVDYLVTGHFGEATFENWESEFLQMSAFVLLTAFLFQKGSRGVEEPGRAGSRSTRTLARRANRAAAPWPVRRGGIVLTLYESSLSIDLRSSVPASRSCSTPPSASRSTTRSSWPTVRRRRRWFEYVESSRFWFESFQNWQSEFLSLAAMVVLSIFLRQRGSPESKPVAAPTWETGH